MVDIVAPMDTSNDTAVIEDTAASAISFATVYDALFAGPYNCSSGYCHGSGAGGLTVTDETGTHFALANQNAVNPICGLTKLVVPGDPEQSLLWRRVRPSAEDAGDPCAPPKMPDGSDGVDAATADLVYSWIADGALP